MSVTIWHAPSWSDLLAPPHVAQPLGPALGTCGWCLICYRLGARWSLSPPPRIMCITARNSLRGIAVRNCNSGNRTSLPCRSSVAGGSPTSAPSGHSWCSDRDPAEAASVGDPQFATCAQRPGPPSVGDPVWPAGGARMPRTEALRPFVCLSRSSWAAVSGPGPHSIRGSGPCCSLPCMHARSECTRRLYASSAEAGGRRHRSRCRLMSRCWPATQAGTAPRSLRSRCMPPAPKSCGAGMR